MLPPILSIRNGRRSVVITGTPEQLSRFELYCSKITEREEAERKNKLRGGAVFSPVFTGGAGRGRLPHPAARGRRRRRRRMGVEKLSIDSDLLHHFTKSIFTEPVDWVGEVERLHEAGAQVDRRSRTQRHHHPRHRTGDPRTRRRHRGRCDPSGTAQPVHRRRGPRGCGPVVDATRRRRSRCPTDRSSCPPSSPGSPVARRFCSRA